MSFCLMNVITSRLNYEFIKTKSKSQIKYCAYLEEEAKLI